MLLLFAYRFINFKFFVFLMCAENEVLYINMYRNALGVNTGTHYSKTPKCDQLIYTEI